MPLKPGWAERVRRASARVAALAVLWSAAACVGTIAPIEFGDDHPANPGATTTEFVPLRPDFVIEPAEAVASAEMPGTAGADAHGKPERSAGHEGHGGTAEETPRKESTSGEHAGHEGMDMGGGVKAESKPSSGQEGDAAVPPEPKDEHGGHGQNAASVPKASDQERLDELVGAYLAVARALAADDFGAAKEHALHVRRTATDLNASEDKRLRDAAQRIAGASAADPKDIAALRETFKGVSSAMIDAVRLMPQTRDVAPAVREVYCPMADASWLQESATVANPYFGAKMPRCGKVTRVIEGRAGEPK